MKFLHGKAGVTVLEGVIALGLLAVVTAGAFGVLASASRKSSQPDMREEMTFAVERAKDLLQMYKDDGDNVGIPTIYQNGLCTNKQDPKNENLLIMDANPLRKNEEHNIICMLPLICDPTHSGSGFTYEVLSPTLLGSENHYLKKSASLETDPVVQKITFTISCNGYEL